jgi:hypothetical protein
MILQRILAFALATGLTVAFNVAHADDVCSDTERSAANAQLAKAKAAETAGNLEQALKLAQGADFCVDDTEGLRRVVVNSSYKLGQAAEAAGKLEAAFDYYQQGMPAEQYQNPKPVDLLGNAKRVALAMVEQQPANRQIARRALQFMNRENLSDGVTKIVAHMDAQARRLLAEEQKAFSTQNPHTELLEEAEAWLQEQVLTGVPESTAPTAGELTARWVARGDQFAALDYHSALSNALSYYQEAERTDKEAAVRAKARKLADGLASSNRWGEAVRLYELAGDSEKAEALTREREASAAEVEAERKEKFEQEQADLEKEFGF